MDFLPLSPRSMSPPVTLSFDDLLHEAGGFGRFQVLTLLILCISRIILPLHFLQHIFISAVPPHHCTVPDHRNSGNLSQEDLLLLNIPQEDDGSFSSCQMFSKPQPHQNTSQDMMANGSWLQRCDQGWEYERSTFSSTTVTQWDLVCEKKGLGRLLTTFFFIGVTLGTVSFGYLSDRFGRRAMLFLALLLSLVFGGLSAGSVSYPMFVISLMLSGFSVSGLTITVVALSLEWVDTQHRTVAGVITSLCWSIGSALLALIAYLIRDWRWLVVSITAPSVLGIVSIWWLSESPRWLLTKGFIERGEKELARCAAMNGRKLDWISKQRENIQRLAESLGSSSTDYSYIDLFRTPRLRRISICAGLVWFGVAFSYYGISLDISGFGLNLFLTHFLYSLVEVPAKLSIYHLLNYLGRRRTQVLTLVMTGACIGANVVIPSALGPLRTTIAIIGKGFSEASFTAIILYTAELYPTVIRQNGIGYTSFLGRIGVSLAPLMKLLDDFWAPLSKVIFCSMAVICGLMATLLPETLNVPLPEIINDVEQQVCALNNETQTKRDPPDPDVTSPQRTPNLTVLTTNAMTELDGHM
ncbi:solute carrier family 22 member 7 isoform X2 [Ranitomeya variabilis]|uniref:solute carrier family 22 member 7 isoform X2 n=1 Tax=Ranitomeya variabilis TaxID=490064 RepID=UPI004057BB18